MRLKLNIAQVSVMVLAAFALSLITTPTYAAEPQGKGAEINITHPTPPVYPEAKKPNLDNLLIGDRVVLAPDVKAVYWGQIDGEPTFKATFGLPEYCADLETPINCRWLTDGKVYWTDDNVYFASVVGSEVKITYDDKSMVYNPTITLGGEVYKPLFQLPVILPTDSMNENYSNNVLQWDYGVFKRQLRIIEGMLQEFYIFYTNPHGDFSVDNNAKVDAGFSGLMPMSAKDAAGYHLAITNNTTILAPEFDKATYPVVVDPDVTYNGASYDGFIWSDQDEWDYVRDDNWGDSWWSDQSEWEATGCYGNDGYPYEYYIGRSFFYFDTSALPDDCEISAATIKLRTYSNYGFLVEIQQGTQGIPGDDYDYDNFSGSMFDSNICGSGYNEFDLTGAELNSISKTGYSKYCVRDYRDYDDNEPNGDYWTGWYFSEKGAGYYPQIEITYTATETPTVSTRDATDISLTTATLNGYIDDDGGEACDVRFVYDTDSGEPYGNYTAWINDTYTTSDYPDVELEDLTADTTYYFRIEATNDAGGDEGDEYTFDTLSDLNEPTSLTAIPRSDTELSLTWTKGVGSSTTHIQMKVGDYPDATDDGTNVYSGSASSVLLDDLEAGVTYYFRAWGVDAGEYSDDSATELGTTLAGVGSTDFLEESTEDMPDLWGSPDTSHLTNLPGYDLVNAGADAIGLPRTSLWIILLVGISICVGASVFVFTKNTFFGVIGAGGGIIYGWQAGVMPLWILIVYFVMVVSIYYIQHREGATE